MAKTAKKPAKKGAPKVEEKKRPMVVLDPAMHKTLRIRAAEEGVTIRAIVIRAIEKELQKGGTKN